MDEEFPIDGLYKFNSDVVMFTYREGRPTIVGYNQGGYDAAIIDLWVLLAWLREKHPEIMNETQDKGNL